MTRNQYETTPIRAAASILAGLAVAVGVAHSRVWGALLALGAAEWFDQLLAHLLTIALDFGPSFALMLLTWVAFDRFGLRDAKYAVLVGVVSFYVAPRLYAVVYLIQTPFSSFDMMQGLFMPTFREIVIGAVFSLLMWAIAYWRPAGAATSGEVA